MASDNGRQAKTFSPIKHLPGAQRPAAFFYPSRQTWKMKNFR